MDQALVDAQYCYITTLGRVTGNPHTIEIWFALVADVLYVMAGDGTKTDWVRNLQRTPEVHVRIEDRHFRGEAHVVHPSDAADGEARRLLLDKYRPGYSGDLTNWERNGLPVAIRLEAVAAPEAGAG